MSDHLNADDHVIIEKRKNDAVMRCIETPDCMDFRIAVDVFLLADDGVGAKSQPFPVWALGPVLEGATNALVKTAQCQPSLAASSLFAHAAGAVQAIVDVRTVRGKLLTTVALIAIAESSEGKSLVWNVAAAPFHEFDKWLETESDRIKVDYTVKMIVWVQEHEKAKKADLTLHKNVAHLLDVERRKPVRPNFPSVTFPGGGTLEGLINSFRTQVPSSVSSTAEGAQFFRGAAFGERNAASSASMTIDLIDTGGGGRDLMGDGSPDKGRIRLRDVRFSQITAVQPAVIAPFLGELAQAGQGYHARYLKVAPEPIAHEREFDSLSVTRIDQDPRVLAYNEVMRLMLHSSRFTGHGFGTHPLDARGVKPLELTLSDDATVLHDRFAQEMARLAGPGERYCAPAVTEVAKKTAERALRFAGVLYTVDAFAAPLPPLREGYILADTERRLQPYVIGVAVIKRAIALAQWFLEEERRYYLALTQVPESATERVFLDWLRRTIERQTDGEWRPLEGTVEISKKVTCNGWLFAKDDRKRAPSGVLRPGGKSTPKDRDAVWVSMFEAMSTATPPRCYLLGEKDQRGLKVLIPRHAVYP